MGKVEVLGVHLPKTEARMKELIKQRGEEYVSVVMAYLQGIKDVGQARNESEDARKLAIEKNAAKLSILTILQGFDPQEVTRDGDEITDLGVEECIELGLVPPNADRPN